MKLTEEHKRKMQLARGKSVSPNVRGIHMRRKEPGEVSSRSDAIKNFCRECLGWDSGGCGSMAAAVKACNVRCCWLHPYRMGAVDPEEYS